MEVKTQINVKINTLWKAPFTWACIALASDEEANEIIANCKLDIEKVQKFMGGINLLDKVARLELDSVKNCTTQLQEVIVSCERRLNKSKNDYAPSTEVYTTTLAHKGR